MIRYGSEQLCNGGRTLVACLCMESQHSGKTVDILGSINMVEYRITQWHQVSLQSKYVVYMALC